MPYVLLTRTKIEESDSKSVFGVGADLLKNKIAAISALFLIIAGFYIFQVNQLAVVGYEIKNGEKENQKLQKEVTQLQIEVEKMKTASNLHEKTQGLNMVESKQIGYVYVSNDNVALASAKIQ